MPVINSIVAQQDEMTAWRRDIHAHPELGFEEVRTAGIVADKLKSWGLEVHTGIGVTGVVGVLHGRDGDGSARTVGLRADMDALPMTEETGLAYQSTNPGVFHGCGHDGHTTMLLGAAKYLSETRNFSGTVNFIFQPAEEGKGGADRMIKDGLFDRFNSDEVYALHNWPYLDVGQVGVCAGPAMAASDEFHITIRGRGGHAAMPHGTIDPILAASHVVTALQSLVSRSADPVRAAVLSVTQFHAGSAFNVIPDSVYLCGTARSFDKDIQDLIEQRLEAITTSVAAAFGATAEVTYRRGYPATVNPPEYARIAADIARDVCGADRVLTDIDPVMGAEDFAFMLEQRPGAYLFVGQEGGPTACSVHNPQYDFNDEILPIGASLLASIVESRLSR